jgi:hypothetical protein
MILEPPIRKDMTRLYASLYCVCIGSIRTTYSVKKANCTYLFSENISVTFERKITRKKNSREATNPAAIFIPKLEANSSR